MADKGVRKRIRFRCRAFDVGGRDLYDETAPRTWLTAGDGASTTGGDGTFFGSGDSIMMISDRMNERLNDQIALEFSAAHSYLAMSCCLERMGLTFLARRFRAQHREELEHAYKIIDYLQQVGGSVKLRAVEVPRDDYANLEAVVQAALDSEQNVTRCIFDLVRLAEEEHDPATRSFLNWFVDEQVEEVASMTDLLNLVRLAGDNVLQVESRVRHEMTEAS